MGKKPVVKRINKQRLLTSLAKQNALTLSGGNVNRISPPKVTSLVEQPVPRINNDVIIRKHMVHLELIREVEFHLRNVLDQPVTAQLIVNAIQRTFDCLLATIFAYDPEKKEFKAMAVSGYSKTYPPPDYHQRDDQGLLGKVARQHKTIVVNDTRLEPNYFQLEDQPFLSEAVVPLIFSTRLQGVLVVDYSLPNKFSDSDVVVLEIVAELLVNAWERSGYHQRLTELIGTGIALSTLLDAKAVVDQVAVIVHRILDVRFVFVILFDKDGSLSRVASSGDAPLLLRSLQDKPEKNPLIQAILNSSGPMRMRDLRKTTLAAQLRIDQNLLKGMLALPIRLHHLDVGAILAFGKTGKSFFTENDDSLVNLVASQASAAIEISWLYQELRSALQTATLLYQLSINIMQAVDLKQAASAIAVTVFRLGYASISGIVLFSPDGTIQAQVEVDSSGTRPGTSHPTEIINEVLKTRQKKVISDDQLHTKICIPLQTDHQSFGVLWLDIPVDQKLSSQFSATLHTLCNQATVALERSLLLVQTRDQAQQLEAAYTELETTYDLTLVALTSALDARDRETEGHSIRVGKIATMLGSKLGLSSSQIKSLERGSLLHDIGKIGISDTILLKPGPLTENEWEVMRRHPDIGAHIIEEIPFLSDTIAILRYHHERWDGNGYPVGLSGTKIPLLARIFAVADAFDAMVSDRPYRKGRTEKEASEFLVNQKGAKFDPEIATVFQNMIAAGEFGDVWRETK